MPSPQDVFAAEMATLRDQLVEATRERRHVTLDAGLEIFVDLADLLLQRTAEIDQIMTPRRRFPSSRTQILGPGPESGVGAIGDAFWPVLETAVLSGDREGLSSALSTTADLLRLSWSRNDLVSFDQFVVIYVRAARLLLSSASRSDVLLSDLSSLVQHLNSIWEGTILARRDLNQLSVQFSGSVLRSMIHIGKEAIDEGRSDELHRWADRYAASFTPLSNREFAESEYARQILRAKHAGHLALRGWILFRWKEPWIELSDNDALDLLQALDRSGLPEHTWESVLTYSDRREHLNLGWEWWETALWPASTGARAMHFDDYFSDAAVAEFLNKPEAIRQIPDPGDVARLDREEVRSIAAVAEALVRRAEGFLGRYEVLPLQDHSLSRLQADLGALIEAAENYRTRELVSATLDGDLVESFRTAVVAELFSPDRFTARLAPCALVDDHDPDLFGLSLLVTKEYFIHGDVHADANSLGRQFGRDVLRGESERVLARVASACDRVATNLEELSNEVLAAVERLQRRSGVGSNLAILVFGDFDGWMQLRDRADPGPGIAQYDQQFHFGGVRCELFQETDSDMILVADLDQLICHDRMQLSEQSQDLDQGGRLGVTVESIDIPRARRMASKRLGEENLGDEDLVQEVLEIQRQVHVRVFIRPQTRLLDRDAGIVIDRTQSEQQ